MITAAPTYQRIAAEFEGAEAHAGIRPEEGRSAIAAAAAAIAAMELGRLDPETTANVGVIEGGTASNVVPGRCRVEGEARSIDDERAPPRRSARWSEACTWAAGEHGCDVDVEIEESSAATGCRRASPALALARGGARALRGRAARVAHRRGQRRKRARRARLRLRPARQRDRGQPHLARRASRPATSTACSRSARRSSPRRPEAVRRC